VCKIVGGDEGRRPEEEVGRTPRLEVGCIQRRVEGSGGVTHTETAEEVRKDWEVGEFSFSLFFLKGSLTRGKGRVNARQCMSY
jgi:hypothetical protein